MLTLIILLVLSFSPLTSIMATEGRPIIPIYAPPSRSFPLKIYVYPKDYDYKSKSHFLCAYHDLISMTFHQVVRDFRKVVYRFSEEYPQYEMLTIIRFANTSRLGDADIVLRIIRNSEWGTAYTLVGAKPYIIEIDCSEAEEGANSLYSTLFHEFGHALGLDHPPQLWADDGTPELMRNTGDGSFKVYPSALDLYAIYVNFFTKVEYGSTGEVNITLPQGIEYKMVIPYDVELYKLRLENENLRDQIDLMTARINELTRDLKNVTETVKRLDTENRRFADENKALKNRLLGLEDQLSQLNALKEDLEEKLAQARADVSRLQEDVMALQALNNRLRLENQNLKNEKSLLESENQELRSRLREYERQTWFFALTALAMAALALGLAIHAKRKGALK